MHRFKEETGYTLHSYIEQKRLLHASELIKEGAPAMKAAQECGFKEYSTFLRAFKRNFHISPKELLTDVNALWFYKILQLVLCILWPFRI